MNSKVETVEELKGRRKTLHLGMLKLAQEDLALALQANHAAHQVRRSPPPLSCRAAPRMISHAVDARLHPT